MATFTGMTLRAGTKFRTELPDGTLSEKRELEQDLTVTLLVLDPAMRVYMAEETGSYLYVEPADDVVVTE